MSSRGTGQGEGLSTQVHRALPVGTIGALLGVPSASNMAAPVDDEQQQQIFQYVLRASKDNDTTTMAELLSIDKRCARLSNQIGQTGLHVAAIWGNLEVGLMLVNAGADVNAQNQFGVTPLASAAGNNKPHTTAMVKFLLEKGADPTIRAANGIAAFEVAKTDAVRQLLGAPALKGHSAVIAADHAALLALLDEGLDVSLQDSDKETILHLAVKAATGGAVDDDVPISWTGGASRTMLNLLLKHENPVGLTKAQRLHNNDGQAPLHIAAAAGDAAICDLLLQAKHRPPQGLVNMVGLIKDATHNGQWGKKNEAGEIEKLSAAGSTPLHLATQVLHDRAEAAEDEGVTDVTLDASLVRVLLKHGANPNSTDGDLQTPLHIAIMGGLHEVAQLLCEAKADLSLGCKPFGKNNTALHQAVILRDTKMIQLLCEHGAHVDAHGRDGWTPLCMAVRSNAVDTAKVLLDAKADVHAVAGNGKTALEVAKLNNKKPQMLEMLQAMTLS